MLMLCGQIPERLCYVAGGLIYSHFLQMNQNIVNIASVVIVEVDFFGMNAHHGFLPIMQENGTLMHLCFYFWC